MCALKNDTEASADRPSRTVKNTSALLAIGVGFLLSALCLKLRPYPCVWLGWAWTLVLIAGARLLRTTSARAVAFNAAVLLAILAATETYFALKENERPVVSDGYYRLDDVLGTAPRMGAIAHASRHEHGKLVYDVTYTIDSDGLRIAPPVRAGNLAGSILFFGGSFTFGEGLQDDETLPYQVGVQSQGAYRIYNFAFHGYGPHQMLASIESGRVLRVVDTPPRYAIYQLISDHVARVAGKIPYGKHSPRYVLDSDGVARLHGHFGDGDDPPSAIEIRLDGQLRKSALYRTIANLEPRTNEADVRLLLAIVRKSRDELAVQFPGIQFQVILWSFKDDKRICEELNDGLTNMNIPVHSIDGILPDFAQDPQKYILSPVDGHPNALADREIASYVVANLVEPTPSSQPQVKEGLGN